MHDNWLHQYIPKLFGGIAYIVNPIFVYLVFSKKTVKLGNYRYLLLYFATFNVTYSTFDILVPLKIHLHRHCFTIFISGGLFAEHSAAYIFILLARCSLISCTYAVLISHFLFRYLVIRRSPLVGSNFPSFMVASFVLCVAFFAYWFNVCLEFGKTTEEKRNYLLEDFRKEFNIDPANLNLLSALLANGSRASMTASWWGIGLLSALSLVSVAIYIIVGCLIMHKLNCVAVEMSQRTRKLQRDLLKALIVQTVIPICVSFAPCLLTWYAPAFDIDLGSWINELSAIDLAAFPFFDPLAIIMCLPVLRYRIAFLRPRSKKEPSRVHTV